VQLSYRTKESNGYNNDKDSGDDMSVSLRRYLDEIDTTHSNADFNYNREYQGEYND